MVESRLEALMTSSADALISSAACGIDLIGLKIAEALKLSATIILPSEPDQFKSTSVIDRPGQWEQLYDSVIARAQENGTLRVLDLKGLRHIHKEVNRRIIEEGLNQSGSKSGVLAVAGWEGQSKGDKDNTADFIKKAVDLGLLIKEVSTLER